MTDIQNRPSLEEREAAKQEGKPRRRKGRSERVPLSAMRQRLLAPERKGFVRRWINDDGGRTGDFERAGYAYVEDTDIHTDGEGSRVSRRVGVHPNGQPMYAFLMEQKQEYYSDDQATKNAELDKVDEAIRRGNVAGQDGQDGRYIPSQGITIER